MTADDSVDPAIAEGTDRRTALKKAAIAAGVVAWTTPAVQAVTARPAFAQTVTACKAAVLSIKAILTGPNCKACPDVPAIPSCCSGNTYFLSVIDATCGPTCPGAIVGDIEIVGGTKPGNCNVDRFLDDACKTATVTIKANIKCGDGVTYTVTNTVPITCTVCAFTATEDELSTTGVIEDELIEQPSDTVAAEGGGADTPTEQPAPSGQDPPSDQPAEPVPAGGESPPAGGEPPGDTPESGSSP